MLRPSFVRAAARCAIASGGALLALSAPALARPVTSVASIRIERPAGDRVYRPVFSESHLASELQA
ncbi:MAG TPA: hypothetical protein VNL37_03175, partial [Candidatus Polarisedimenticolia bacterium]|nr:hypothetical protein [Candidatus Polarisedimenticolia bacterium]